MYPIFIKIGDKKKNDIDLRINLFMNNVDG